MLAFLQELSWFQWVSFGTIAVGFVAAILLIMRNMSSKPGKEFESSVHIRPKLRVVKGIDHDQRNVH